MLAVLFEHGASDAVRVLVPTEKDYSDLGFDWTGVAEPFDDSGWTEIAGTPNGVGFDRGSGAYDSAIGLDVEASMYEQSTTLFARAAFDVNNAAAVGGLTLRLRYDDAFIAWINGVEVARNNTTEVYPAWDAQALNEYEAPLAPVEFDISDHVSLLQDGTNVLAIRLLNDSPTGDDALLQFTLVGERLEGMPVALDDEYTVVTDTLSVAAPGVLANDVDLEGDPLIAVLVTAANGGLLDLRSDGSFAYIRRPDFSGVDTLTYRAFDGAQYSAIARVSIQVPNTPPTANADAYEVDEDGTLAIAAAEGVLANDTDPQHHSLTSTLISDVEHGALTLSADGSFTYIPDAHFFGADSFSYRADDGADSSNVVAVSITVLAVNDAPRAVADVYSVAEGETLTITTATSNIVLGPNQFLWSIDQGGNGHVYEFVPGTVAWSDAARAAQNARLGGTNGHLAVITSAAENAFLTSRLALGPYWIGAYQNRGATDFVEPGGGWPAKRGSFPLGSPVLRTMPAASSITQRRIHRSAQTHGMTWPMHPGVPSVT
jgi:VCBS repeat-containing protein